MPRRRSLALFQSGMQCTSRVCSAVSFITAEILSSASSDTALSTSSSPCITLTRSTLDLFILSSKSLCSFLGLSRILDSFFNSFFFKYIYWLCYDSCPISTPPLHSILSTPSLPHSPPYSSCPWVILMSSLASTFPTLFLPSPCLFSTYHLCYLFSVPFPPSPPPPPTPLMTTLMF